LRWTIGVADLGPGDGAVALTLDELRAAEAAGALALRFDELLAGAEVEPADEVHVHPSMWRGHSFIALCEWIVCAKLAAPGSRIVWVAPARGGATGVRKVLESRSWEFTESKDRRLRVFEGSAPQAGPMPSPRSFVATLGPRELSFAADWGAFSLGHVDEGTRRLFDAAYATGGKTVADVGTGYGAVAIGLAVAGAAETRVHASDVDLVSLHLARRNAEANGVEVALVCDDDPSALEPTKLTTCEIPTHVPASQTQRLVDGLTARARRGSVVLVAVHMGLVARYSGLFADAGADVHVEDGDTHAILTLRG
jgi:precorrin-6B methylase 2